MINAGCIKRIDARFRTLEERVRKLEDQLLTERTQRVGLEDSLSGTEERVDNLVEQNGILLDALKILADQRNWQTLSDGMMLFGLENKPWQIARDAVIEVDKLAAKPNE